MVRGLNPGGGEIRRKYLISNTKVLLPQFLENNSCRWISQPSYIQVHRKPYFVITIRRTPTGIDLNDLQQQCNSEFTDSPHALQSYVPAITRGINLELR